MHIWNVRALADKLRSHALSERDKLTYLLGVTVITALSVQGGQGAFAGELQFVFTTGYLAVALAGIVGCYRANQAGDDQLFLERYVCLSLPTLVHWIVVTYTLVYGATLVNALLEGRPSVALRVSPTVLYVGVLLALEIAYYVWLSRWVGYVAQTDAPMPGPAGEPISSDMNRASTADHGV